MPPQTPADASSSPQRPGLPLSCASLVLAFLFAPGCSDDETTAKSTEADCVSCHTAKARPRAVIHVTTTDHLIRRKPPEKDLTAAGPDPSTIPGPLIVVPAFPDRAPEGDLLRIYNDLSRGVRFTRACANTCTV